MAAASGKNGKYIYIYIYIYIFMEFGRDPVARAARPGTLMCFCFLVVREIDFGNW